jgi:succinate dehydrogenase / fumarate reductase, cytochrome b subunit
MPSRFTPFSSTVVTKVLIAFTGFGLFLFLVAHLLGNLLIFVGPEAFNQYAHRLITNPFLIPAEIGLAALFVVHAYKTITMWFSNRRARPVGYEKKQWAGAPSRKSVASSTMIWTGLVTLFFLVLHLRTFRFGAYYQVEGLEMRDLHRLVIDVFQSPLYVGFYVVAMVLLGFHLWHGFGSAFESLGINSPAERPHLLRLGRVAAVIIAGGFLSIPVWVYIFGGPS